GFARAGVRRIRYPRPGAGRAAARARRWGRHRLGPRRSAGAGRGSDALAASLARLARDMTDGGGPPSTPASAAPDRAATPGHTRQWGFAALLGALSMV